MTIRNLQLSWQLLGKKTIKQQFLPQQQQWQIYISCRRNPQSGVLLNSAHRYPQLKQPRLQQPFYNRLGIKTYNFRLLLYLLVNYEMSEEFKSQKGVPSVLKKTRATCTADSSGEKEFRKFETEKKVDHGESVSTNNSKRRIQFSQTKLSLFKNQQKSVKEVRKSTTNPQRKLEQSESKEKQSTVDEILSKSLRLTKSCYDPQADLSELQLKKCNKEILSKFNKAFRERVIKILREIKYRPKELACHLNTVFFSRENVRLWDLQLIEKEIFKQWRQNVLLSSIKTQWIVTLQQFLPEFEDQGYRIFSQVLYEDFCILTSHLTYIIFEPFYSFKVTRQGLSREEIIERLNRRTMRYIVTQSTQWQNIIYLYIEEIIRGRFRAEELTPQVRDRLVGVFVAEMKVKPIRGLLAGLCEQKQTLFPETQRALAKFLREHYIPSKIKCITGIRVALDQDLITYQKQLIEQNKMETIEMLEKDPMLTCLILAVLSSGIDLQALDLGVREVQLMLGRDLFEILSYQRCPSYFADLVAVVDQLNIEVKRENREIEGKDKGDI